MHQWAGWRGYRQKGSCPLGEKEIGRPRADTVRDVQNHQKNFFSVENHEIQGSCESPWMIFRTLLHLMQKWEGIE